MAVLSFNSLPLGFRFRPTDEELITYYLRLKINGKNEDVRVIREIDVCKWEPWDLPDMSEIRTNDMEWFFFCPRDRKYPNGHRLNRATAAGYWKATGRDRQIKSKTSLVGMKKTLVFHTGRAPNGKRTNWVMHEYRATTKELDGTHPGQSAFVLCRLFKKQDGKAAELNPDEAEATVPCPTPAHSPEETECESLPPVALVEKREEEQPGFAEGYPDKNLDEMTPESLVPVDCFSNPSNACDEEESLKKQIATEVDPSLLEDIGFSPDQMLDPLHYQLFSPLHSEWHLDMESYTSHPLTENFSHGHKRGNEYGSNENDPDVTEFLESVLKDSGSCSGSDAEVVQAREFDSSAFADDIKTEEIWEAVGYNSANVVYSQNNFNHVAFSVGSAVNPFDNLFSTLQESSSFTNAVGSDDIPRPVFKTRTRQLPSQSQAPNFAAQGTAHRRIRLQQKLVVGPAFCRLSRDLNPKKEAEVEQASERDSSSIIDEIPSTFSKAWIPPARHRISSSWLRVVLLVGLFVVFTGSVWMCHESSVA